MFYQPKAPQVDRKQACQAVSALVILLVYRGQREKVTFEASEISFHQVFGPVRQHSLLKEHLFLRGIGGIHPPSQ